MQAPSVPRHPVPNHHAGHPGFSGISGWLAGLTMIPGRGALARFAAGAAAIERDDRLVDVGCGPGVPAREAARRGATVAAVDPAAVMLRLGRRLTKPQTSIEWLEGTAEVLPIADGWASVLWSIATVHHWQDVDTGLAEARRVLEDGGRLLAIERRTQAGAHGLASHGWTDAQAEAFAARCRVAGFEDVVVERAQPGRSPLLLVCAHT
jgi:ubiquinone/menaquinone biosynthesis C-methylase UbiE